MAQQIVSDTRPAGLSKYAQKKADQRKAEFQKVDRIQWLNQNFRGKSIRVFRDPVTKTTLQVVGIIRAISLPESENDEAPFFHARVQDNSGVFTRRVSETDIID